MPASLLIFVVIRSLSMAAVAIGPIAWRWRPSAKPMFGLGAVAWFGTVALKVAWALPMNQRVHDALAAHLPATLAKGLFDGYVGVLTGVFEVGLLFALARFVRRFREATADDALAFGLGFGGIEALVLALSGLATIGEPESFMVVTVLLAPLERASATVVHVVCCTLVLSPAFRTKSWHAFGLAFAFKSFVDAVATFALVDIHIGTSQGSYVAFELGIVAVAMAGLFVMKRATMLQATTA